MKYVPSAFLGELRGSQGSTTASRNKFATYLRNRATPVNPNSPAQTAVRVRIQAASGAWRLLSLENQLGWIELGQQMVRQNSLGQTYNLTGVQAYTSVWINQREAGFTPSDVPPLLQIPQPLSSLTLSASTTPNTLSVAFTPTPLPAAHKLVIEATRQVSNGINFMPRSEFRQILVTATAAASPQNILLPYSLRFGALIPLSAIFIRARVFNAAGFASDELRAKAIVAAPV